MHIAGGLYQELCCMPKWDAVFGSGVRAAVAVSNLALEVDLYTYSESSENQGIDLLEKQGVTLHIETRPTGIVFSYFHPLSTPHIQPSFDQIDTMPSLRVSGEAVLRFGFLEGDTIVDAKRAVYDPQSSRKVIPFGVNGSIAEELAIVLNENELLSGTGLTDINAAASRLIEQGTQVVVVKRGVRGATIFEKNGRMVSIPVYRSSRVFKIGTGDVFSAIFAHYWAEKKKSVEDAADIASRSVAVYCDSRRFPIQEDNLRDLQPIPYKEPGSLLLLGDIETIGQRYTMEEARFVLNELGVDVFCPSLGYVSDREVSATLILADGIEERIKDYMETARKYSNSVIVLSENREKTQNKSCDEESFRYSTDFVSAIYHSAWATFESAD